MTDEKKHVVNGYAISPKANLSGANLRGAKLPKYFKMPEKAND